MDAPYAIGSVEIRVLGASRSCSVLLLQDSIRHFMCTLLGEMVLVRNVGHRCQDHTENDLAKQLNSETVTK